MKKVILILIFLVLSFGVVYAEEDTPSRSLNILDDYNWTIGNTRLDYPNELPYTTDNDYSSWAHLADGDYFEIVFDEIVDIESVKHRVPLTDKALNFYFYDSDGNNIKTVMQITRWSSIYGVPMIEEPVNVESVKKVRVYNFRSGNVFLSELDFVEMLPKYADLVVTTENTIKKIRLNWDDVGFDSYNLYLNNSLITTLDNTAIAYTFDNLTSNTTYNVKLEAVKEGYRNFIYEEDITTLNYFALSPNTDSNIGDTWINVNWNEVNEVVGYQVQLDDGEIIDVSTLSYKFDGLLPDTEYTIKIRSVFEGNMYSDWKILNIKTLPPPEAPPYKPDSLSILENTTDSIKVEVSETLYADSYVWYINNNKVGETTERTYTFTGLDENTSYSVACRAKNEYGESRFPVSRLVKTLEIDRPKVTNVKSENAGYSAGGGLNKKVTWESENVEEGYELYVDGTLVGEYDTNIAEAVIDYEELGLSDGYHEIEVVPKDSDGIGYKIRVTNQSTGNKDIDQVVGFMDKALQIIKKGGIYFLIILISFSLSMLGALFLFNKFKLGLVTTTPEQIEADPDEAMIVDKKDRHIMDKQVKKIADNVEDNYYRRKQEDRESEKITNKVPKYRMQDRNTMIIRINGRSKTVEIDDIDNYLKHVRMNKYDKQLVKNALSDWNNKSKGKQAFHLAFSGGKGKKKELTLGGYKKKEEIHVKGGDGVENTTEEERVKYYEDLIYDMANDKANNDDDYIPHVIGSVEVSEEEIDYNDYNDIHYID